MTPSSLYCKMLLAGLLTYHRLSFNLPNVFGRTCQWFEAANGELQLRAQFGIFTRFPILPALRKAPKAVNTRSEVTLFLAQRKAPVVNVIKKVNHTGKVVWLVVPHCHVATIWAVEVTTVLYGSAHFF